MIGKEERESEEHLELKVTDKRKFNPDGSLREGVVFESEPKKPSEPTIIESGSAAKPATAPSREPEEHGGVSDDEYAGADDPASFISFLSTLASQAAAALGAMPHPVSGQRTVDLDTGKYWIDVLLMLRDKTRNNLHPDEKRLFEGLIGELQMQYVAMTRAAEERLKKQAAQKFSSKDILGG